MLGMVSIRTGLLLVTVILLFPSRTTAECIAAPPAFFAEHATVVFSGTVTRVEPVNGSAWAQERAQFVSFNVDRVWKGKARTQFAVYSFTRSVERYALSTGTRYLVFAHAPSEQERSDLNLAEREAFVVGQCGDGTRVFREVLPDELAELGPGSAPLR